MKVTGMFIAAMLATGAGQAIAAQLPAGKWVQTSSTAGDCADCEITVSKTTPQILHIASNNGWAGYAVYSAKNDTYIGAFQWDAAPGGQYENVVFKIELTYEGKTLSVKTESEPLNFSSTYRKK